MPGAIRLAGEAFGVDRFGGRLPQPVQIDKGGTSSRRLLEFVDGALGEVLCAGDTAVADNLPAHKSRAFREALAAREVELQLLPPYSPDLNPTERYW